MTTYAAAAMKPEELSPEKQARSVLVEKGGVAMDSAPVPAPGARQVQVKIAAVGICGSDVHYYEHGRIGDYVVEQPLVLGHEAAGVVTAVGSEVSNLQVGDRVALEPQETCGRCVQCLAGRYNLCPDVIFFATPPVDGAFAEYVVLDSIRAHPVPDGLSDEAAALIEPLSVAVWAAQKAGIEPGDRVLVTGAGPIGLLCVQVARARGAAVVVASDTNDARLEKAFELGATRVNNPAKSAGAETAWQEEDFTVVLECSGAAPAIRTAFTKAAPAARIVLVGMGADELMLPLSLIQNKELVVTGTFRYANVYPAAIALAASGAIQLDELVTGHFGLDEVELALTSAKRDPSALKAIVHPGQIGLQG